MTLGIENCGAILGWLYPQKLPGELWALQATGNQYAITKWDVPGVSRPTIDDVMARESDYLAWRTSRAADHKLATVKIPNQVFAAMLVALKQLPVAAKAGWPAWVNTTIENAATKLNSAMDGDQPSGDV